ncbi:MAG: hypothetical protein A2161_14080 [Candidatus Schekmanbacteria bacterium RBG_13_48_7]|uniref:Uncharacterized protein n=1 Tax=Candidatus Schekmanbacteria bacterium RBG_13_48_7 TaxID=1817878 RepID=A0A1F7S1G6_9BACT|nr:MAG: hypothetical protein A2161_14080 [Candidatus Schekmanbacteria bacterium RBG_13_48_7]
MTFPIYVAPAITYWNFDIGFGYHDDSAIGGGFYVGTEFHPIKQKRNLGVTGEFGYEYIDWGDFEGDWGGFFFGAAAHWYF